MSTPSAADESYRFAEAVASANVPTLLMVLVQLTGDQKWLHAPYLPIRSRGLSDNETGGLSEDIQATVRSEALTAILAWRAGAPVVIPTPSDGLLISMMSVAMGEEVPAEYAPMIAGELGLGRGADVAGGSGVSNGARNAGGGSTVGATTRPPEGFRAIIIGGGISGICAAVRLQEAGVAFTIIERNSDVGGVWLENTYPGAAVDTPSHLYSFSFAQHDWSKYFALQPEILSYLRKVADDFDIRENVRYNTTVESAEYDETAHMWSVATTGPSGAETFTANVVISAVGAFNKPKVPHIAGAETFCGPNFHTAHWPADIDLTGKRVAVVGNGASAMQVVPAIVDDVASLVVFQHSPQWAAAFEQFHQPVPDAVRFLLAEVPLYYAWYRTRLAWIFNDRLYSSLQRDPEWPHPERSLNVINDAHRRNLTRYIETEVGTRTDLLEKLVPSYPPFGKRMLLDNGWFRSVAKDHVTVETDRIHNLTSNSVVTTAGTAYEVDIIVWATGFDVVRFLVPIDIRGKGGVRLHDVWEDDDARAFLGTAIPEFPNFFVLYGPNTQFGHGGSLITIMERQVHYLMTLLQQMFRDDLGAVEVRHDVHDEYNQRVDAAHERMVWTHPGMDTYYRNARGRVVVNNPFRMQEFWQLTDQADLNDYTTEPTVQGATA
jgi:4-hydroxyacetophenone monooxygenase